MEKTERGPQWGVPRPVWQLVFVLCFAVGMVPMLIVNLEMDQLSNTADYYARPDLLLISARALVFGVYVAAVAEGIRKVVRWLFGPIPPRRRDRAPVS